MNTRLEEVLIQENLMTKTDLESARKNQSDYGKSLFDFILTDPYSNHKNILKVLERKYNVKFIDLDEVKIDYNAAKIIPEEIAYQYCAFAFNFDEDLILVAMADPFDIAAIDAIRFASRKEVKACICLKEKILFYIEKFYNRQSTEKLLEDLQNQQTKNGIKSNIDLNSAEIQNAPMVRIVDYIINQAVQNNASDIHIEPFHSSVIVRIRIDGALTELIQLPQEIHSMVAARIKIMSRMETAEKRIPQDGKFHYFVKDRSYDFRVSTLPTIYGEKIVIRILYKNRADKNLELLGFSDSDLRIVNDILNHSSGMVLITGPTGSGKSTTLYSMLNQINKKDKNIITIEDPVEYTIQGINQVNVSTKAGLTFASGLRSILRQDPDVIMIGEIRDKETAEIAVRAAITGHLVFSTIHTKDSASSIVRLMDMGIAEYLISDSILAIIAQRLVKKICPVCKDEYPSGTNEQKYINPETKLFKGIGCSKCRGTGYSGRTAVYEILYMDSELRKMISSSVNIDDIRKHGMCKGMRLLREGCESLVNEGITTFEEYLNLVVD